MNMVNAVGVMCVVPIICVIDVEGVKDSAVKGMTAI